MEALPSLPPINGDVRSTGESYLTVEQHTANSTTNATILKNKIKHRKKRKDVHKSNIDTSSFNSLSSSSSTSNLSHSRKKGVRLSTNRRNPRVFKTDALALPLGMSIAAFVAQVLEQKDHTGEKISVQHLSEICTLAVKESLSNIFGDKFDCFVSNFERSFQSTLSTLRVISDTSGNRERSYLHGESRSNAFHSNMKENASTSSFQEQSTILGLEEVNSVHRDPIQNELAVLHGSRSGQQLACVSPNQLHSGLIYSQSSMLTVFEKSVHEQARSNDLKALEISLSMKRMRLKEAQIAVDCDSNVLERFKLSMGISKAKFRAEKFKTELEDLRRSQLLRKCADCLVAGLLFMLACLAYGTYIHSYQKLIEATESCMPIKESISWWIPKPMASFSSGFHIIRCQVQVISRMLFGILMIIAITFLLIQCSGTTNQTMPITFILLLLGVGCGFAGKFCIDTLGGSGTHWLFFWELLCLVHLFANICTAVLFHMLYGPVTAADQSTSGKFFPYWLRRVVFYAILLVYPPLLCGLMPFAGVNRWLHHFASLVTGHLS